MNPKNDLGETPTKERDERKEQREREREMVCTGKRVRERDGAKDGEKRWTNAGNGRKRKGNTGIRRRERKRGGRKIELNGHRRERVERHDDNRLESVLRAFKYHRYRSVEKRARMRDAGTPWHRRMRASATF